MEEKFLHSVLDPVRLLAMPGIESAPEQLNAQRSATGVLTVSDRLLLSDGQHWLQNFFQKLPSFCQPIPIHNTMQEAGSSFSIILVHAGSCSSIQGPLRFMQVHLGSTQGGPQFRAFNYTVEGEGGGLKEGGRGGQGGGGPTPPMVYRRSNR